VSICAHLLVYGDMIEYVILVRGWLADTLLLDHPYGLNYRSVYLCFSKYHRFMMTLRKRFPKNNWQFIKASDKVLLWRRLLSTAVQEFSVIHRCKVGFCALVVESISEITINRWEITASLCACHISTILCDRFIDVFFYI
jgi:hypothetical protein